MMGKKAYVGVGEAVAEGVSSLEGDVMCGVAAIERGVTLSGEGGGGLKVDVTGRKARWMRPRLGRQANAQCWRNQQWRYGGGGLRCSATASASERGKEEGENT
ncbi:hypothetical protein E2562_023931 [Oryza meyeriana var. granulata]|uniref:Uncharacterized protein n=1 Tax=Oryza meyeriana var. granulata TaxID=110450 RepID=A0A6G1BZF6_9ORYZ|nr:hypothetical protein E2562_023931 [Oryza meyeriana var. granulata]